MKRIALICLAALIACALTGCGSARAPEVVGTWKADVVDKDQQKTMAGEFVQRLLGMTLDFRPDGTCTFTVLVAIPGKWHVEGDRVVVELSAHSHSKDDKEKLDIDVDKPFDLDLSTDGQTLLARNEGASSHGDLVFRKQMP